MTYRIVTSKRFNREFAKLDMHTQKMMKSWISKHLSTCEDPRSFGKPLVANRRGQWRYRIGDYRIICEISDNDLVILALTIGHRREIY